MKLDWYTCLAKDGHSNAGTSVLWTEYGLYQWINREDGRSFSAPWHPTIEIVFFPRTGKSRVVERIGKFKGEDRIERAEAAVVRNMNNKSTHDFVSSFGNEFCDVCGQSCIGHD